MAKELPQSEAADWQPATEFSPQKYFISTELAPKM